MSWLLGKHRTQEAPADKQLIDNRKKALNSPNQKAEEAYLKKLEEQRIKNAEAKAIKDADNLANQQPFYKKLVNIGAAVAKDLGNIQPNPDALINFNEEKPKRAKRKKRKH